MRDNPEYNRTDCYFCAHSDNAALEEHHVVPSRYNGSDDDKNMVKVCANCHRKLESLYDKRFYEKLGVEKLENDRCGTQDGENELDVDVIQVTPEANHVEDVIAVLNGAPEKHPEGAPVEKVIEKCELEEQEAQDRIEELKQAGDVYEPRTDHLRGT